MSEGLQLELIFSRKKADAEVDAFIKRTKTKMGDLGKAMSGGSSKGGKGGKGGRGKSQLEEQLKDEKVKIEKEIKNSTGKARQLWEEHYRKLDAVHSKNLEQTTRQRRRVYKRMMDGTRKYAKDVVAAEKDMQSKVDKVRKASVSSSQAVASKQQRLREARLQALHRISQAEQKAGFSNIEARKRAEARIAEIMRRARHGRLSDAKRALSNEVLQHKLALGKMVKDRRKSAAEIAAIEAAKQNKLSKNSSRWTQQTFQVQQAIEDFSFAGFRGASNNIALLASQMGGPGGIIAMVGLMGVTLAPTIAKMLGWEDQTKKNIEANKRLLTSILDIRAAKGENEKRFVPRNAPKTEEQFVALGNELQKRNQELEVDSKTLASNRHLLSILQEIDRVTTARAEARTGFIQQAHPSPDTTTKFLEKDAKLLAQRNELIVDFNKLAGVSGEHQLANDVSAAALKTHLETVKKLVDEQGHAAEVERQQLKDLETRLVDLGEEVKLAKDKAANAKRAETSMTLQEQARRRMLTAEEELEQKFQDELATLEEQRKAVIKAGDRSEEIKLLERAGLLIKDHMEMMDHIADQKQKLEEADKMRIENERKLAEEARQVLRIEKDKLSQLKSQNSELEREISQQKRLAEQAKERLQGSRDSFDKSAFGLVRGKNNQIVSEAAERAKAMDRKQNPFIDFLGPDQMIRKLRDKMIDAHFQAIAKAREKMLLEARGKFLDDKAKKAASAGDFEGEQKALKELQDLQMEFAGSTKNLKQASSAFEKAKQTQAKIEASIEKQKQKAEENLQRIEKSNQALVDALRSLENAIREKEGKPPKGDVKPPQGGAKPPAVAPKPGKPGGPKGPKGPKKFGVGPEFPQGDAFAIPKKFGVGPEFPQGDAFAAPNGGVGPIMEQPPAVAPKPPPMDRETMETNKRQARLRMEQRAEEAREEAAKAKQQAREQMEERAAKAREEKEKRLDRIKQEMEENGKKYRQEREEANNRIREKAKAAAEQRKMEQQQATQDAANLEEKVGGVKTEAASVPDVDPVSEGAITKAARLKQELMQIAALSKMTGGGGGLPGGFGGGGGGSIRNLPKLASGGPVVGDRPYIVGEEGQEVFVPSSSGHVVNAKDTAGLLAGIMSGIKGTGSSSVSNHEQNFGSLNFNIQQATDIESVMDMLRQSDTSTRIRKQQT